MTKKITNKQYTQALFETTKDLKGEKLSEAIKRFVLLLARRHKLKRAEQIIAEYEKCVKRENGEVEIVVKTAGKLEKTLLNKVEKVFGDKVETKEELDENLLGGVVIKTEDRILDGSLRRQLFSLRQKLI
ncbi:MAG: ATP synthase F1 subunit delta [Candidatus Magasanikbacteria bacterium]|nr:ATP synthase F1 subunit delta [Candidatus Magasanikbacteria bacterium]